MIGLTGLVTVIDSCRWLPVVHPDWGIARAAGHTLLSSQALHLYRLHPRAQMGPLALLLAQLPRPVYVVVVAAAVALCLHWFCDAVVDAPTAAGAGVWDVRRLTVLTVGAVLAIAPWAQLAWKGHADDALVLTGSALLLSSAARGRTWGRWLGLGVAVAGKPTALALAPFMLTSTVEALAGAAVVLAVWGPFAAADPQALLQAGKGVMTVAPGSLPAVLGVVVHSAPPVWVRAVQLVGGTAAAVAGLLRGRWLEGLLLAFALRAVVEPNPAPAYAIPLVVMAIAVDVRRRRPVTLPFAAAGFWLSAPVLAGGPGGYRLAALLGLVAVVVVLLARPAGVGPES